MRIEFLDLIVNRAEILLGDRAQCCEASVEGAQTLTCLVTVAQGENVSKLGQERFFALGID